MKKRRELNSENEEFYFSDPTVSGLSFGMAQSLLGGISWQERRKYVNDLERTTGKVQTNFSEEETSKFRNHSESAREIDRLVIEFLNDHTQQRLKQYKSIISRADKQFRL